MKLVDPLAQSFYVEPSSGIFVTSVDLYFYDYDPELPVTIQLRPMRLGLPTDEVYPFSEVVLDPQNISTSTDGSVATRVTFDSPVYLTGGVFHCLTILTNSDKYYIWTSKLGEFDSVFANGPESKQVVVTKQPLTGGLFKSQNNSTWNESPYEDLKFTLYRANFTQPSGNINFYSPELSLGNQQIATLIPNALEMTSKVIRVGLGTTVQDSGLVLGNTIVQQGTNGSGNYVGSAGSAIGTLDILNAGIGYTPSSGSFVHNSVSLTNQTGNGLNATADITISNGVAVAATINYGGTGYQIGDVLTVSQVGTNSLGRNLQLSVSNIYGINQLILDNVQGEFSAGVGKTVQYINSSGITTDLNASIGGNVIIPTDGIQVVSDGLHVKVNHKNHGMYAEENALIISNVVSDVRQTRLTSEYAASSNGTIFVDDTTNFGTFENVGVGNTNPGYLKIGDEIIAYEGTTATSFTGITRQIDQTKSFSYSVGTPVQKYELNGISLRRINAEHTLQDATVSDAIDLDYYNIKIDTTQAGKTDALPLGQVNRGSGSSFPQLFINETKSTGGNNINATQNIQFEILRPNVQKLVLNSTNISSRVRTVDGTSVDGSEISFSDNGFENISLDANNYFNSPRLICSKVNEDTRLTTLPGKKSLTLSLDFSSTNAFVSPVVDLDRVSMVLVSNRINNAISNYTTDNRVATLEQDPSSFVYATNSIQLEVPSTSIKIIVSAYINEFNDLRSLYSIQNDPNEDPIYYPFPGFANLNNLGQTINPSLNDGTSDAFVPKTDVLSSLEEPSLFKDYEFTVDNLPPFRYFSIKLVGSSTNQAYPPKLKDLRVIALA